MDSRYEHNDVRSYSTERMCCFAPSSQPRPTWEHSIHVSYDSNTLSYFQSVTYIYQPPPRHMKPYQLRRPRLGTKEDKMHSLLLLLYSSCLKMSVSPRLSFMWMARSIHHASGTGSHNTGTVQNMRSMSQRICRAISTVLRCLKAFGLIHKTVHLSCLRASMYPLR